MIWCPQSGPGAGEPYAGTMPAPRFLTRAAPHRWALEPALGVVLALAWGIPALWADQTSALLSVWMFAIAVGLSRFAPLLALLVGGAATLVVGTGGPGYLSGVVALPLLITAGCLVVWGAALYGRRAVRFVGLAAALLLGMLVTVTLLVELHRQQAGNLEGTLRFVGDLGFLLTGGLLSTLVLVGGWVLALVLRGRSDRREAAGPVAP